MGCDEIDDPFPDEHAHSTALLAAGCVRRVEHPAIGADGRQIAPIFERIEETSQHGDFMQTRRSFGWNIEQQEPARQQYGKQNPAEPQPAPSATDGDQQEDGNDRQGHDAKEEAK